HITIRGNSIHDISFSANPGDPVTANTKSHPVLVTGNDTAIAISNVLITGNEIFNCRTGVSDAVYISGNVDGFSVNANRVHDVSNDGIVVAGHTGSCADAADDCPRNGDLRWNNTWDCVAGSASVAGISIDGAKKITVENNLSFGNGFGIEVTCRKTGETSSDIIVRNNIVYNNLEGGLIIGGYNYPAGSGMVVSSSFTNNTIVNNYLSGNPNGEIIIVFCEYVSIRSNIVYTISSSDPLVSANSGLTGLVLDDNLYYSTSAPQFSSGAGTAASLPAWATLVSGEAHSVYGDPQFLDGSAMNFHLLASSPAIDAGDSSYVVSITETDMDTMMRVQNDRIDIGADEYGTAVGFFQGRNPASPKVLYDRVSGSLQVIYPSPARKNATVNLTGVDGKVISSTEIEKGKNSVSFDVSELPVGTYIIYSDDMKYSGVKFVR
ncbi:MAG TPA: choice-of-anchor Q domain-containing protein, partial [Bacteroidia bacterium]|nr:choice-of-anchor Q domain-containing protein [Bacteroidia bacterium]